MNTKHGRAYITINLNNVIDNVKAVNEKLNNKTKIFAVKKADVKPPVFMYFEGTPCAVKKAQPFLSS